MTRKRQNGVRLRVHTYTWKGKRSRVDYVKVCSNGWNNGESTFQANKTSIDGHVNSIEIGLADSCDVTLNVESSGYGSKKKKYAAIKEAEVQEWSKCREELVEVASELEKPCSFVCELCQKATDEPIRCIDCHANFICCAECEQLHHILRWLSSNGRAPVIAGGSWHGRLLILTVEGMMKRGDRWFCALVSRQLIPIDDGAWEEGVFPWVGAR